MFEHRRHPVIPRREFALRMLRVSLLAGALALAALGAGVLGYHCIAGFPWVDSLLNASMILGGMGPVGELPTAAAKVFAAIYALFSGLVFVSLMAIILTPVAHRLLHRFHVDERDLEDPPDSKG